MDDTVLLGNEAIGLALIEHRCKVITSYPGSPSSEILPSAMKFKRYFSTHTYTEWSVNEKVAYEVALAASWVGLRAAVVMKQAGLNVACDPFFNSAYTGVKGGFLVISADDPGPVSSQTEQDSRLVALAAKIPVFDPSSPAEARSMIGDALNLSEKYQMPVLLRPVTRLCHAIQNMPPATNKFLLEDKQTSQQKFSRDPQRWTATPKLRFLLHEELNKKLLKIEAEFVQSSYNCLLNAEASKKLGVIASGVVFHTVKQVLDELCVNIPILKIGTPYPLPQILAEKFISEHEIVVVFEETDACVELQLSDRRNVKGKLDGTVPRAGELTPEVILEILTRLLIVKNFSIKKFPSRQEFKVLIDRLPLPSRAPSLCPGCSHRSAFFILRREFGDKAIYPGDIGCNTLGKNLKAVDTFLDMGASISMADGFYQANRLLEDNTPIVATIGDSTFLHAGIPALINAVHNNSRFVLVILDNHVVAMTGFQPTTGKGVLADGSQAARKVSFINLAKACGVEFVEEVDPYNQEAFRQALRNAYNYSQTPEGGIAIVIANHPCILKVPESVKRPTSVATVKT